MSDLDRIINSIIEEKVKPMQGIVTLDKTWNWKHEDFKLKKRKQNLITSQPTELKPKNKELWKQKKKPKD